MEIFGEMQVLILGDAGVGKTNYINSITGEKFIPEYIPTDILQKIEYGNNIYYDFPGQCVFW